MKQEFINIAAREFRTPIQPILGLVGLLRSSNRFIEKEELDDSLNLINRNAEGLKRLSEDILDVTKIDSESLKINKSRINLKDVISGAVQDIKETQVGNKGIKILLEPEPDIIVEAPRNLQTLLFLYLATVHRQNHFQGHQAVLLLPCSPEAIRLLN